MNEAQASIPEPSHDPVMLPEVLSVIAPSAGETYVDATYGAGGYTRGLLKAAPCRVIAIDRDEGAVRRAERESERWSGRLTVVRGRFGDMDSLLAAGGLAAGTIGGVAIDLGLSSLQLADAARGFSFAVDGPLDMRMDPGGLTAAEVVNSLQERELADVFFRLGGERRSRRIAAAIVKARAERPIERTADLASLVSRLVPRERRTKRGAVAIHPATRTFQALRVYVNDEIGELLRGLAAAERVLAPLGRLAVVSFHSVEDREVKRFLAARSGRMPRASRHSPPSPAGERLSPFRMERWRALRPGDSELTANPRARSARMRWAVRTEAPAWGLEPVG